MKHNNQSIIPLLFGVLLTVSHLGHCIEWPVFFEHLGFVHSVHNKLDLVIKANVQLPSLEKGVRVLNQRLDRLLQGFLSSNEDSENVGEEHSGDNLEESLRDSNVFLKRKTLNLLRQIRNLKNFGRNFNGNFFGENIKSRMKRDENSAFEGRATPGVLQSLFGVAYTDDVTGVESRLNDLENKITADIESVNVQTRTIADSTDIKIRITDGELKKVENMTEALEKKLFNMEINPLFRSASGDIFKRQRLAYEEIERRLSIYIDRFNDIKTLISTLATERLSMQVIPQQKLRITLNKLQSQLPRNYSLLFDLKESLWPYYSIIEAKTIFGKDLIDLEVHLNVPLLDNGNQLELSKVHNLPLKVRDGYSVTADIDTEYLVTDAPRRYYLELFKEDLADCKTFHHDSGHRHFYCNLGPMLKAERSHSCVMSLFQGNTDTALCQSKLKHGLVAPFNRLYNGSWIFSALIEQVPVLLKCPDGDTPTGLIGFGVIHLAEGCSISSKEYFYPDTFSSRVVVGVNFGDASWSQLEGAYSNEDISVNLDEQDQFTDEVPNAPPPFTDDFFETEVLEAVEAEEEGDEEDTQGELTFEEFVSALADAPNLKQVVNTSLLDREASKSRILSFE